MGKLRLQGTVACPRSESQEMTERTGLEKQAREFSISCYPLTPFLELVFSQWFFSMEKMVGKRTEQAWRHSP